MMLGQKIRARVLEVEPGIATLGIYAEGAWHRIRARTEVPLEKGGWINCILDTGDDDQTFRLRLSEDRGQIQTTPTSGLDLEA